MLTEKEQAYIEYWEANRERESKISTQLLFGIPVGLLFALPVFLIVFTSRYWYKRADMLVNARLSPWVLLICVFLIVLFVSIFYKRHQWDMREQQYLEFKAKNHNQSGTEDAAKNRSSLST